MRQTARVSIAIAIAMVACLAVPSAVLAQGEPKLSLAGAYVFLAQSATGNLESPKYSLGWLAAGTYRLGSGRLSAAGEFGISYRKNSFDERQHLMGVLGGARWALTPSKRIILFAQGLAGLERFSEPGLTESGVAVQPGGGMDWYFSSRIFMRAQGDYRWSVANDSTFHAYRIVVGGGYVLSR